MYLIQYSEAAERLGWNVKDCTDDNNSVIISRNGVSGRVYDFKLNKENFITDMERLASQFDADAYAMEYHSTHKNWSERNILGEIVADCYKIRDMLFPLLEAMWICEPEQRNEPVMLKDCICASVIGNTHDGILDDDDEKMRQFYIECLLLASDISNLISRYAPNNDALKAESLSHMAIRLVDASSRSEVINGLKEFCDEWKDSSCQEPYQRAHAILEQMQIAYDNFSEKE